MNKISIFVFFAFLLLLGSCNPKDIIDPNDQGIDPVNTNTNASINDWIYKEMKTYYLWNEVLPVDTDKKQAPDNFFASILSKDDRFSWIQNNYKDLLLSLNGVNSGDLGFEYFLYSDPERSSSIYGQINYVKPQTPAHSAGLKRGDIFAKVNGTEITETNYRAILNDNSTSIKLTFVDRDFKNPVNKTINKVNNYAENPVFLDSVYHIGNKKIAYLVYNFFASDKGDQSMSYNLDLNRVFSRFKSENITDMVLDLRYNGGGSMQSNIVLSSMIVPNLNANNVLSKIQYNNTLQKEIAKKYGEKYFVEKFVDKIEVNPRQSVGINNLGNLSTLYVLTSRSTASASEMLINGLRPYMNVVLIGDKTVGKNVGSISIYEPNDPNNKWGIQPIVVKYFNSQGLSDFTTGFNPDISLIDNHITKYELGDIRELMLNKAIEQISGITKAKNTASSLQDINNGQRKIIGSSSEGKLWFNRCIVDNKVLKGILDK